MLDSVSSCSAARSATVWPSACSSGTAPDGAEPAASPTPQAASHVIADAPTLIAFERVRVDSSTLVLTIDVPQEVDAPAGATDPSSATDPSGSTDPNGAALAGATPADPASSEPPPTPPPGAAAPTTSQADASSTPASAPKALALLMHVVVNVTHYVATRSLPTKSAGAADATAAVSGTPQAALDPTSSDASGALADAVSNEAGSPPPTGGGAPQAGSSAAYTDAESFTLALTTQEGDSVQVDFRQLVQASLAGPNDVAASGAQAGGAQASASLDRSVALQVTGNLSDAEKSSIDSLLQEVVGAANAFFGGDTRSALDQLAHLDLDPKELASLSLSMSQTRSVVAQRAYVGADAKAQRVARADGGARRALLDLGQAQRRLIGAAKRHFDDASAATLVTQLMARLLDAGSASASPGAESAASPPAAAATDASTAASGPSTDASGSAAPTVATSA